MDSPPLYIIDSHGFRKQLRQARSSRGSARGALAADERLIHTHWAGAESYDGARANCGAG